jgi:peroxiredoxin
MAIDRPLEPGDRAPDFELPAADRDGVVSLAQYRAKAPVLLALFRGLYCPFCRHQMARLSPTAERLKTIGIDTLGIVATAAPRARLYFRVKPSRFPLGADPDLATHRAYGLSHVERNAHAGVIVEAAATQLALELGIAAAVGDARGTVDRADGFESLASDQADRQRHQIQMTGQFLVDRDGVVRWSRTETTGTYARFPATEELLSLVERVRA